MILVIIVELEQSRFYIELDTDYEQMIAVNWHLYSNRNVGYSVSDIFKRYDLSYMKETYEFWKQRQNFYNITIHIIGDEDKFWKMMRVFG